MTPHIAWFGTRRGRLTVIALAALGIGLAVLSLAVTAPDTNRENWPIQFSSNGERLYFTGRGAAGAAMVSRGGNRHMSMMGGGGCVDCHGTDREGGRLRPSFWQVAPAVTVEALLGDHGQDGHDHKTYTNETLARAIAEGVRPDGSAMGQGMPRWSMSSNDINDLVTFLLGKE